MTKDDIIRMAREAGLPECHTTHLKALERFAELVAAAEHEALTDVIMDKAIEKVLKMEVEGKYTNEPVAWRWGIRGLKGYIHWRYTLYKTKDHAQPLFASPVTHVCCNHCGKSGDDDGKWFSYCIDCLNNIFEPAYLEAWVRYLQKVNKPKEINHE